MVQRYRISDRAWRPQCVTHSDICSENVVETPAGELVIIDWDDAGSWSALARTREPDSQGNVRVGAAHAVDARNNIAWADDGEIVLFGVDNLVVVRSGGVTLVTRRDSAPDLKKLVTRLRGGE